MVTRRRDKGGEEREQADGNDPSRIARRAARDKAFGRDPGNGDNEIDHDQDSARNAMRESGQQGRREVPMTGSAREVRRLRSRGVNLQAMLEQIKCDEMAADISKKRNLFYLALGAVGIALTVWGASLFFHWSQVTYVTRFSILAAPVCIAFGINDLCLYIARTNPVLARRILGFLSFGNPHSVRTLAWLYIDTGDYSKAEKTIAASVKAIDPKKKLRDYILMHAFLANLRAHVGRTEEAEQLIREVLNAAEAHNKERETDGSAFLLANTLNYAAQLCDQKDKIKDALALSRRSVQLLCDHKQPPPEVCLVSLSNAGYYCNVVGEFQEALTYLTKAHELATKTNIARDGQIAFILSNLAIANLGVGRSTMCKRNLNDAETRAMAPLGLAERPHTYQCWAIYHFANDRLEYALQSYEKAIEYCSMQKPRDSVLLLRIIKEYSVLLREVGKSNEADENEQRVTQIRDTLYLNARAKDKKDKKDKKANKPLAVPVTKSRFPIFWTMFACFWCFELWNEGLRLAPFTRWLFCVSMIVVVVVKVLAKYGPRTKEEASQGAIVAVVSLIPGLRSIVPELGMLSQKTSGIIIGTAVALIILVQVTVPPPDTVPDFGLLSQEYLVLGDELAARESFTKAKKAYDLAIKNGESHYAKPKLIVDLPKAQQSDEAIDDNMKALELSKESPKEAKKAWEACVRKYPDFEYPYVHLAVLTSPSDFSAKMKEAAKRGKNKAAALKGAHEAGLNDTAESEESKSETKEKALEAERLLQKALSINPNCGAALLAMYDIQNQLGRVKAGRKYMKKYMTLVGETGMLGGLLTSLEKVNEDLEKKNAAATEDDSAESDIKDWPAHEGENAKSDGDDADTVTEKGESSEETDSAAAKKDGAENEKESAATKKGGNLIETTSEKKDSFEDENDSDTPTENSSATKQGSALIETPSKKKDSEESTKESSSTKKGSNLIETPSKKKDSDESTKDSNATKKGSNLIETTSKKKDGAESTKDSAAPKKGSNLIETPPKKKDAAETTKETSAIKKGSSLIETPSKKNASTKVSKPVNDDDWGDVPSKASTKKDIDTKQSKTSEPAAKDDTSASSKSSDATAEKAMAKKKKKQKELEARKARRRADDWMKFSPDDTDW